MARIFALRWVYLMQPIVSISKGRILSTRSNSLSSYSVSGLSSRFMITIEKSWTSSLSTSESSSSAKFSIKITPIGSLMSCLLVIFASINNFYMSVQMTILKFLSPPLYPFRMMFSTNGTTFFLRSSSSMYRTEYSMILSVITANLVSTNSGESLIRCGKSWCWLIRLQASWLYIRERWQKQKQACEMIQLLLLSTFPRILMISGKNSRKES